MWPDWHGPCFHVHPVLLYASHSDSTVFTHLNLVQRVWSGLAGGLGQGIQHEPRHPPLIPDVPFESQSLHCGSGVWLTLIQPSAIPFYQSHLDGPQQISAQSIAAAASLVANALHSLAAGTHTVPLEVTFFLMLTSLWPSKAIQANQMPSLFCSLRNNGGMAGPPICHQLQAHIGACIRCMPHLIPSF